MNFNGQHVRALFSLSCLNFWDRADLHFIKAHLKLSGEEQKVGFLIFLVRKMDLLLKTMTFRALDKIAHGRPFLAFQNL